MMRHETLSERLNGTDPSKDTREPRTSILGPTAGVNSATPCPHCRSTAKHTDRIGCCSGCKVLFTSMSAFDAHRRVTYCLTPAEAGLVEKTVKGDPSIPAYGLPRGNVVWEQIYDKEGEA